MLQKLISTSVFILLGTSANINQGALNRAVDRITEMLTYHYNWHETDTGAPTRLKPATKDQRACWPELAAYREIKPWEYVYLL